MAKQRKTHTESFKAKVALEALKGNLTANQVAKKYGVHPHSVTLWKKMALEGLPQLMSQKKPKDTKNAKNHEELTNQLYQQIGQLKVELDWLKKKSELF